MSVDRQASLSPRQKLHKRAARDLIEAVGGVDAAAQACRAGKSQLSDYCNANVVAFMPIDVVADLEAIAPAPVVTRMLAGALRHELVQRIEAAPTDTDWHSALAEAVKETDDVIQRVLRALPNGVSAADIHAGDIRREIAEAQQRLAHLDALCARALEVEAR